VAERALHFSTPEFELMMYVYNTSSIKNIPSSASISRRDGPLLLRNDARPNNKALCQFVGLGACETMWEVGYAKPKS
jgi:hypothetical protein